MPDFRERVEKQFRGLGEQIRLINLVVAVLLPIIEAILINLITGQSQTIVIVVLWLALAIIVIFHFTIARILLKSDMPLPELILDRDNLKEQLDSALENSAYHEMLKDIATSSIELSNLSLLEISKLNDEPKPLEDAIEAVLYPWIIYRSEVFLYSSDSMYNFAVYLADNDDYRVATLNLVFRDCDDRMSTSNRSWTAGDGHVGFAFL